LLLFDPETPVQKDNQPHQILDILSFIGRNQFPEDVA